MERERAPRRDAQQRREALIAAAEWCFEHQGYDVPLEYVAERAGVGRGTLYRNFQDREALALAIFTREIDRLEARLTQTEPMRETIAATVRDSAKASVLFSRIAVKLESSDANLAKLRTLGERMERALAPAVARAHARGEIDPDITPGDVALAMRMVGGLLLRVVSDEEADERIEAALALLFRGLRPR